MERLIHLSFQNKLQFEKINTSLLRVQSMKSLSTVHFYIYLNEGACNVVEMQMARAL